MAVKFTNNAKTTLASGINSSVTTATVTDGSVFPTLGSGEHFYCTFDDGNNNEIVKVTARSGNTLTIVRGVDNTTARAFSASDAAELRATSALLTDIQENIAAKSANQTVYSATTASSATSYDIGIDPGVEANASVFLNGVYQHHNTFSFSGSTLTFDTAPPNGMALEVLVDNLVNLQSSNLTVDTFTAADVGGNPQTDFTLSDAPAAEDNLLVFIDGVFQDQDAYTISNQTLTITDGVTADFGVTVYVINPVNIGTPSDNTVTSSKLSGNITMPADLTVTGDVAFDSPTFVVDNANSRVGIGTASPSTLLDIVGDVKMSANLTVDTSTLVVDASNNRVGIGTATPSNTLDVVGGFNLSGNLFVDTNVLATNVTNNRVGIGTASPSTVLHISTSNDPVITLEDTGFGASCTVKGSNGNLRLNSTTATHFDMGGSEIARFDSSGRLGIGTTSPSHELTVGDANAETTIGVAGNRSQFGFKSDLAIVQGGSGKGIQFNVNNNTFGSGEAMRIDASGNVGIGETSPQNLLHVKASDTGISPHASAQIVLEREGTNYLQFLTAETGTSGVLFGDGSDVDVSKITVDHNTTKMTLTNEGVDTMTLNGANVGIGTASPDAKLKVEGDGTWIRHSGYGQLLDMGNWTDGLVRIESTGAPMYIRAAGSNYMAFDTNSVERMRIDSSGNVGIGSGSPTSYNSAAQNLVIKDTGNVGITIAAEGGGDSTLMFADGTGGTAGYRGRIAYVHASDYMRFDTAAAERMRINSDGDLLLGTTAAQYSGSERMSLLANGTGAGLGISCITAASQCLGLFNADSGGTRHFIRFAGGTGGPQVGSVTNVSSTTSYNTTSDYRLKENITYEFNALDRLAQLKPARFNFIADGTDRVVDGFIAHEVQDIVPEAVAGEKDAVKDDGTIDPQGMDASKLVPLLTKAIQEQQEQIETLKQEIREIREGG